MSDLGSILKRARQERGLTLHEIAAATKISPVALEALEHNDYSRLPGGIFSRAFVRAYALEVGLDAEAMVSQFLSEFAQHEREAERTARHTPVSADDRAFLERQRRALRTLQWVVVVLAVLALATLAYVAWVWWPAPDAASKEQLRSASSLLTAAAGTLAPLRTHL